MTITDTATALGTFAEVFSEWDLADDLAVKLNCAEVDALADVLRAAGATDAAARWIDYRAEGDEAGEAHYAATDDKEATR